MTASRVIEALALPGDALVQQRVPKKLLLDLGAPAAGDRRAIQDGVEELHWVAALKATNVGVPVFRDDVREYLEIQVLTVCLRQAAKGARLVELIHRAIPYPLFLVASTGGATDGCVSFSVAHKRWSQGEKGQVVLDDGYPRETLLAGDCAVATEGSLAMLAVAKQPVGNLYAMYQGWVDLVAAMEAARLTGGAVAPVAPGAAADVQGVLDEHARIERELVALRARARKEKQMNRRVELNIEIKRLEGELGVIKATL